MYATPGSMGFASNKSSTVQVESHTLDLAAPALLCGGCSTPCLYPWARRRMCVRCIFVLSPVFCQLLRKSAKQCRVVIALADDAVVIALACRHLFGVSHGVSMCCFATSCLGCEVDWSSSCTRSHSALWFYVVRTSERSYGTPERCAYFRVTL